DDPLSVLESQMDVDSFVDFFLITELAKNQDGYRRNTFFYKDAAINSGKFTMGPVTSYGRAFGNADSCGGHQITGWQFVCGEDVLPLDRAPVPFWWRKLTNNAAFVQRLQARWSVLAGEGGALELTAINRFIDSESAKLKSHGAVVRNERKWHSLLPESIESGSGMVTDSERNNEILIAYDREINQLKNWFRDRAAWLDVNLSNLGGAIKTTDTPESISSLATTVSKNSLMTTPGLTEPVSSLAMTAVKPISSSVQVTATELSESGSGEKTSTPMEGEGSGSGLETSFTSQSEPTSSLMAESSAASVDASSVLASSTREADISSTQSMLSPTALPLSSSDLSSSVPGTEPSSSIAVSSAGAVRSDGGGVSTPLPEPSSSTQAVISTEIDELDSVAGVSTAVEEEPASSSQVVASTESGSGSGFETTFITKSEPTSSLMTESSTASVDASSMLISSTRGAELSSSQSTAVSTVLPQTPSTLPSSVQMGDSSSSSLMVSSSKSVGSSSELVLSSTKGSELYTSPTVKMSTEALEPMPTDGPTSGAETIGGGITLVMALLVASVLTVF
ncbi:MAG: CotH kinase family protein, partial [Endozoicomonas sp.]